MLTRGSVQARWLVTVLEEGVCCRPPGRVADCRRCDFRASSLYSETSFSVHIRGLDTRVGSGTDGRLALDLFFDISHELCYPEQGTIDSSDRLLNYSGKD